MIWVVGILKFIFSAISIFFTVLLANTFLNSIRYNKQIFMQESDKDAELKNSELRVKLGIIISVSWAIVIAL